MVFTDHPQGPQFWLRSADSDSRKPEQSNHKHGMLYTPNTQVLNQLRCEMKKGSREAQHKTAMYDKLQMLIVDPAAETQADTTVQQRSRNSPAEI